MLVHQIRLLYRRRGKGTAESSSREKSRQAPQKEGGEILCDPGWYIHKPDVKDKWDANTQKKHRIKNFADFFCFCFCFISPTADGPRHYPCLWSPRIFPSLTGSRLTIFYRDASTAISQLVNQWLNFTHSRSHASFPLRKKEHKSYFGKNRTHDFLPCRCAGYHSGDEAARTTCTNLCNISMRKCKPHK